MDGNQFVLLTCLLGQIENYNTMIIPPIKGEILHDFLAPPDCHDKKYCLLK